MTPDSGEVEFKCFSPEARCALPRKGEGSPTITMYLKASAGLVLLPPLAGGGWGEWEFHLPSGSSQPTSSVLQHH